MRRLCLYLLFIALSGYIGLFLGRLSQPLLGSGADKQIGAAPAVIHKPVPVEVVKYVPLPMVSVTERERLVYENGKSDAVAVGTAHEPERPVSHVSALDDDQEVAALVTGTGVRLISNARLPNSTEYYPSKAQSYYAQQLEHACRVLRRINHTSRSVRIIARLQLATIALQGNVGHYVDRLVLALLKRYCDQEGKLVFTDIDTGVLVDVEKGINLLEDQMRKGVRFARPHAPLDPFQKRVQLHAYNMAMHAALTLNCIPYTVG